MGEDSRNKERFDSAMSLGDHLEELRMRLILALAGVALALIVSLFFGVSIITFLERPYLAAMGENAKSLQVLGPADGFISYMNICLVTGLIISSPWVFYQLWMFVAAGLYAHEKRYVYLAVPFSTVMFISGSLFFIFVIAPVTLQVLVAFNKSVLGVESNFTFQKYISMITIMMLVFGLAFQTPIVVYFLNKTGLVSIHVLRKSRKYVLLGVVVVAAAATPGSDMFSLFSLAAPLYLLFELGILLCLWSGRRKKASAGESSNDSNG